MSTSEELAQDFPVPKFVKGGCLCGALRYRVDFPEGHDFKTASSTCQCTQCRKQSSSLFWVFHKVQPADAFKMTSETSKLKVYSASPNAERAFCTTCGSWLYWKPAGVNERLCFSVGTVDPLYLFGEGSDGVPTGLDKEQNEPLPEKGYGLALANGGGTHEWCANEIPGVTDNIPLMRGKKLATE